MHSVMSALSASLAMTVNSQELQNGERHFLLAHPRQLVSLPHGVVISCRATSPSSVYMMPHHQLSRCSLCILISSPPCSITHPALLVAGLCFGLCSSLVACVCCLDSSTKQPEEENKYQGRRYHTSYVTLCAHHTDSTQRLDSSGDWKASCHAFGQGESCSVTSSPVIQDLVGNNQWTVPESTPRDRTRHPSASSP